MNALALPLAHTSPLYAMAELVPITIAVVPYGQRVKTLAWKARPVPGWRVACFVTGLFLIVAAGLSPVGQLSDELVYMHMVEHLVIGDLAPLLLVLGLTGPMLAPLLAIRGLGCFTSSPIRSSPCRCGRSASTPGTSRRFTRTPLAGRRSTSWSMAPS